MNFRPDPCSTDRFFIKYNNGKCVQQPIGINTFGNLPRKIAFYLQLPNFEDFKGHALRRTSATANMISEEISAKKVQRLDSVLNIVADSESNSVSSIPSSSKGVHGIHFFRSFGKENVTAAANLVPLIENSPRVSKTHYQPVGVSEAGCTSSTTDGPSRNPTSSIQYHPNIGLYVPERDEKPLNYIFKNCNVQIENCNVTISNSSFSLNYCNVYGATKNDTQR